MSDHPFVFEPIGRVESCFKEKFGIPRQSGLAPHASARIHLPLTPFRDAISGLEEFSHLWVVFIFHANRENAVEIRWKPRVRPPRLGGSRKVGVLASRSPHRPNPIGLSAVKLERVETTRTEVILHISGADLLDGTPVLDIKPYIPYADSIPRARSGWAKSEKQQLLQVSFSAAANAQLKMLDPRGTRHLRALVRELIAQDPRPAFQRSERKSQQYAFRLCELDVHWSLEGGKVHVFDLRSR